MLQSFYTTALITLLTLPATLAVLSSHTLAQTEEATASTQVIESPAAKESATSVSLNDPRKAGAFTTIDVAVDFSDSEGMFRGTLMQDGQPVARQTVSLQSSGKRSFTQSVVTDAEGKFNFSLLRGGAYLLQTPNEARWCRVWPLQQAPPIAVRKILINQHAETIVRGQSFVSQGLNYGGQGLDYGGQDYISFQGQGCNSCGTGQGNSLTGFQNCDSGCGDPPQMSNCESGGFGCGCKGGGCGGGFLGGGGRNKLLLGLLGGAIIGVAIDSDDGPIEAEVGS